MDAEQATILCPVLSQQHASDGALFLSVCIPSHDLSPSLPVPSLSADNKSAIRETQTRVRNERKHSQSSMKRSLEEEYSIGHIS